MEGAAKDRPTIEPQQRSRAVGAAAEPVPMSQNDIDAMAAGGAKAEAAVKRLFREAAQRGPEPAPPEEARAAKEAPTQTPPRR